MEKKIIRSYNLFQFLCFFPKSFCFATYVLFLRENKLSFAEIGWVNFAFMIAVFAFEVPTGVVADYFGRKYSIIVGMIIETIGLFAYFFATGFWGFVTAEFILALGMSFISGAIDAWVKDSLDFNGSKKKIGVVFSQGEFSSRLAMILGGFFGAVIGNYNLRLPWLAAAILSAISIPLALKLIDESYFVKKKLGVKESLAGMKNIARDSVQFGYRNKAVWSLIIIITLCAAGNQAVNMQWAILFEKQFGLVSVGPIWAASSVFYLFGTIGIGLLIQRDYSDRRLLFLSMLINALGILILTCTQNGALMLGSYFIHEIGRGAFLPIHGSCLQNELPSEKRATIASFSSMVAKIGSASGWLGMGYLADVFSIQECWRLGSVFLLLTLIYVLRWKK
ncbi:MFS transporter [Candidatus Falkowbacteria bacterium]|nr:MFS transporter [Candidatus Falkowbacteria bacterium]